MELSAIKRGRQAIRAARKNAPYHDRRRLNRKEFHIYINSVCEAMAGGEEVKTKGSEASFELESNQPDGQDEMRFSGLKLLVVVLPDPFRGMRTRRNSQGLKCESRGDQIN